jgi:hypothetical protein
VRLLARPTLLWAAPAAVVLIVVVLILWAIRSPRPDRSGTVVAKRAYPETTELVPMYDPSLHMMVNHTVVSGPDWALVVRRPDGETRTVWVRDAVYEACRVGDWYDSARRVCRP